MCALSARGSSSGVTSPEPPAASLYPIRKLVPDGAPAPLVRSRNRGLRARLELRTMEAQSAVAAAACPRCDKPSSKKLLHTCGKAKRRQQGPTQAAAAPPSRRRKTEDHTPVVLNERDYVPIASTEIKVGAYVWVDGSNGATAGGRSEILDTRDDARSASKRGATSSVCVIVTGERKRVWVAASSLWKLNELEDGPCTNGRERSLLPPSSTPASKRARVDDAATPQVSPAATPNSSPAERELGPFDQRYEEMDMPIWGCGELTLRITVEGSPCADRKMKDAESGRVLSHTQSMLIAVLAAVIPRLEQTKEALELSDDFVWAVTLRWARANFKRV